MNPEIVALFIPVLALSIPIFAIWTRHQRKMVEMQAKLFADSEARERNAGSDRTEWLEERVRVLERIVTDKGYDVASQIEALRDAPRPDSLADAREREQR